MKYEKELVDIVKKKEFKTFWQCLDFLLMAGYTPIDAFGISLQEFGESRIFSSVAFARLEPRISMNFASSLYQEYQPPTLLIGLIDDSNVHLSGLYATYRKWIFEGRFSFNPEIEATCERVSINEMTPFIYDYLLTTSTLHFGFEIFKPKQSMSDALKATGHREGYTGTGHRIPSLNRPMDR